MSDLVAWLLAQLADDEAVARAATRGPWFDDRSVANDGFVVMSPNTQVSKSFYDESAENAAHIARHDPARVLAEVEASRKIIALHVDVDFGTFEGIGAVSMCRECRDQRGPCPTLRALAAVFASRPGYDPRWAL